MSTYTADDWFVHQDMLDTALYWLMTSQQQALLGDQGIANLELCLCSSKPGTYDEAYTVKMLMKGLVSLAGTQAMEDVPGGRWILLRPSSIEGMPLFTIVASGAVTHAALVGQYQGENTLLFVCPAEGQVFENVPMTVNNWCISIVPPEVVCEVPED